MHQNFDLDTLKHEIAQLHQDAYFFCSQNIDSHLNFGFLIIMRFCPSLLQYFNFRFNLSILFIAEAVMTNPRINSTFTERNLKKELVSE